MQGISPSSGPGTIGLLQIRTASFGALPAARPRADTSGLRTILAQVTDLRQSLDRLHAATRFLRIPGSGTGSAALPGEAVSTNALGLDTGATSASLVSAAEINTAPTTFSPLGPAPTKASTSELTVGGIYDGSRGDTTLEIKVKNAALVGVDDLVIEIKDGKTKIQTMTVSGYSPGDVITLDTGLTLSFGVGLLDKGERFYVDVSASTGTSVQADNPFDGTRNADPRFDPGLSVGAGSFEVNGITIDVGASDTLNDVLNAITASAAGVDASYDPLTDTVQLTQKTPGSGFGISLTNDTSGFLAATKLDSANVVPGRDDDSQQSMNSVSRFSSVTAGALTVNGVVIALDPASDTLADVLARITASAAGVDASYDRASDRVRLVSRTAGEGVVLDQGTTGFFDAVAIAPGTYDGTPGQVGGTGQERYRMVRPDLFEERLRDVIRAAKPLFEGQYQGLATGASSRARAQVLTAVRDAFRDTLGVSGGDELLSELGIDASLDSPEEGFLKVDDAGFARAVRSRSTALHGFLLGGRDEKGLVNGLLDAVTALEASLSDQLSDEEKRGLRIDLRA